MTVIYVQKLRDGRIEVYTEDLTYIDTFANADMYIEWLPTNCRDCEIRALLGTNKKINYPAEN
jgi:hypothetical protein